MSRLIEQLKAIEGSPGDLWEREIARLAREEIERQAAYAGQLAKALELVLPMAKGYVATHNVGSNAAYIEAAEAALAKNPSPSGQPISEASNFIEASGPVGLGPQPCSSMADPDAVAEYWRGPVESKTSERNAQGSDFRCPDTDYGCRAPEECKSPEGCIRKGNERGLAP